MNLAMCLAAAVLSYYFVEQPMIQYGRGILTRRRAGAPDLSEPLPTRAG